MKKWSADLNAALAAVEVEPPGYAHTLETAKSMRTFGKVFFIGNGGSAAIASHMSIDWLNKGRFEAISLTDPAALTCIANDYGYRDVFERPLMRHFGKHDILFAISSSGESENIIAAAMSASRVGTVITLSGFESDNRLRQLGVVNFYVPSKSYGIVETAHLAILHALLDELAA